MSLFESGIRPAIDAHIAARALEKRDYGKYWGASSAGYCMRLNILRRLDIEPVPEMADDQNRTQRVFDAGHTFHEWIQKITKEAGLSIAQELELIDDGLLVKGHIDDLVLIEYTPADNQRALNQKLILYDYKTANSQSFNYKRDQIGHYHKFQLGTYMYMLRNGGVFEYNGESLKGGVIANDGTVQPTHTLAEARILIISKDDLRMKEQQLMWSDELEQEVTHYWKRLQAHWDKKVLPKCTCLEHDGGFMGRRSKKGKVYNPYFLNDTPCSDEWIKSRLPEGWTTL